MEQTTFVWMAGTWQRVKITKKRDSSCANLIGKAITARWECLRLRSILPQKRRQKISNMRTMVLGSRSIGDFANDPHSFFKISPRVRSQERVSISRQSAFP